MKLSLFYDGNDGDHNGVGFVELSDIFSIQNTFSLEQGHSMKYSNGVVDLTTKAVPLCCYPSLCSLSGMVSGSVV